MRLKELYIGEYKNLKDFRIGFKDGQGLTMLVGNNGSGKSNILEAISAIFHDAYKENDKKQMRNDYVLLYEIDGAELSISQTNGYRHFKCNGKRTTQSTLISQYLPNNVIGVYSGEDDRLWVKFYEPFYKAYVQRLSANLPQERMKLMYVDKSYWDIALLTLLLSENETLKPFIEKELNIRSTEKVVINFNISQYNKSENETLKAFIGRINPEKKYRCEYSVEQLRNGWFYDEFRTADGVGLTLSDGKQLLVRSGITDSEIFDQLIQATMSNSGKIISRIDIIVNQNVQMTQLSEGEKKLILVKAVLEFLADERTLLLFDEPDAHLHEGRKSSLYHMILEYQNPQIVMATHSPTFIDAAEQEQIKLIRSDEFGNACLYKAEKIEAIRHLTGSRQNAFFEKPILFCEGGNTSVEALLYPILFPSYKIISSGGHEEVMRNTKAYNRTFGDSLHKAIGIIDWDYKTERHLNELRQDNIYSLKVVEIENVLMDLMLLKVAQEQFCAAPDSIERVKQKLFEDCTENMNYQAKKYTANQIISKIKSELSPEGRTIEAFKNNVSSLCSTSEIDRLYNERLQHLQSYIQNACFEKLVSIYDFNHKIDRFLNAIVNDYQDRILRLIAQRPALQSAIKEKYYPDIP